MKATSLPINAIIILVLALIVLIAILGFYFGIWNPTSFGTKLEAAKSTACQKLVSVGGCNPSSSMQTGNIVITDFDADKDGTNDPGTTVDTGNTACGTASPAQDNLRMLCICNYFISGGASGTNLECKNICCT